MPYHGFRCLLFLLLLTGACHTRADHESTASLEFGGRVKLDAIYNDAAVNSERRSKADLALSPASIPVFGERDAAFDVNLRESRLWGALKLPLFEQQLAAYAEIDLFDTRRDNQGRSRLTNVPRLRHAYARYGNLTLGKTYTTFLNLSAFPEINDANGPAGVLIVRQPLIRYQHDFDWGNLQFSVEDPQSTLTRTDGKRFKPDDESAPDLIAKVTYESAPGNLSLATMLRRIETERPGSGTDDDRWGGAISLSGRWQTFGRDNIRFAVSYGNALGRYLSYNVFNDGAIDAAGDTELTGVSGGYLAYQHWWTAALRSNVTAGFAHADQPENIIPAGTTQEITTASVNLLWSPMLNLTLGVEWIYGHRQLVNNHDGELNRLQFSTVYTF